jgi:hypothetical protein
MARLQSQCEDNKKRIIKQTPPFLLLYIGSTDTTVSVIIYRIMLSNSNEEALSREKQNAVMANADTNTGSSVSKLAYHLD